MVRDELHEPWRTTTSALAMSVRSTAMLLGALFTVSRSILAMRSPVVALAPKSSNLRDLLATRIVGLHFVWAGLFPGIVIQFSVDWHKLTR